MTQQLDRAPPCKTAGQSRSLAQSGSRGPQSLASTYGWANYYYLLVEISMDVIPVICVCIKGYSLYANIQLNLVLCFTSNQFPTHHFNYPRRFLLPPRTRWHCISTITSRSCLSTNGNLTCCSLRLSISMVNIVINY